MTVKSYNKRAEAINFAPTLLLTEGNERNE